MTENLINKSINNIECNINKVLDVNIIKSSIIDELVKLFHPDRCFFRVYDDKRKMLFSCDNEYLKNEKVGSITYYSYPRRSNEYYIEEYLNKDVFFIDDTESFINKKKDSKFKHIQQFLKVLKDQNIKSFYGVALYQETQCIGILELQFTEKQTRLSKTNIDLIKAIANYASLKLKDAEFFELLEYTSKKEKTLRLMTDEMLLINDENAIYDYFLSKAVNLFNVDAAVFIEKPLMKTDLPTVKHESLKNKKDKSMILGKLPIECVKTYDHLIETFFPVVVNKTKNFYSDDLGRQNFYHKFNIESFMTTPLITEDYPNKAIGGVLLMCHYPRIWKKNEIDLMRSINDIVMRRLNQIKRYKEIENLRDSFIQAMSHDMSIPLIANAKAIEYLLTQDQSYSLGSVHPFLEELKDSINIQYKTLVRYIEIYNYESGDRKLKLSKTDITSLIRKVVADLENKMDKKMINIVLDFDELDYSLMIDETEIYKVIYNFIDNSINYSYDKGTIQIKLKKIDNKINLCVQDYGPGVSKDLEDKLFDRSEMIKLIQRKIGSGLSLYNSKLIMDAHKGKIWYESSEKGATFCISLNTI